MDLSLFYDTATHSILPFITLVVFFGVFVYAVHYFVADARKWDVVCKGNNQCDYVQMRKCRESDKALVACMAAVALLFIIAQGLELVTTGQLESHNKDVHIWHGYDFFSAVTWLFFIHHLRARRGWRRKP